MNYSINPGSVEGNLFVRRPESEGFSGKWKYTVALDMSDYYDYGNGPQDAVTKAWACDKYEGVVKGASGFWLIVTRPYHRFAYPVMVAV